MSAKTQAQLAILSPERRLPYHFRPFPQKTSNLEARSEVTLNRYQDRSKIYATRPRVAWDLLQGIASAYFPLTSDQGSIYIYFYRWKSAAKKVHANMQATQLLVLLQAVGLVTARLCMNITVPVTIQSRNGVFNIVAPTNNLEVTTLIQAAARQGTNATAATLTGYADVSGTYNISTKFCLPNASNVTTANSTMGTNTTAASSMTPVVQILTHGIGFDKTYWDLSYNGYNYSYIDSALAAGYCTLSYDRLGVGNSSHGEPINEIQSFLEVQALRAITTMLRQGSFPTISHAFGAHIVHVGHSFGSAQTYSFANMYPNETSAIILTGFSMNASFVPLFAAGANFQLARTNQPLRFGNITSQGLQSYLRTSPIADYVTGINFDNLPVPQNLPDGYLVSNNVEANQFLFYLPGHFDNGLLYVSEETKQAVTIGELLTLGSIPMRNSFAGPVLVITGSNDLPYCGGDCLATGSNLTSIPAGVQLNFPNVPAANFEAYIQPNTGHGINTHYNSTGAYAVMQNFLKSKGLYTK